MNTFLSRKFCWMLLVLLSTTTYAWAGKVDSVQVFSKAMQRSLPCTIITPSEMQPQQTYPVLYLLHGHSGWHSNWILRVPQLSELADEYQTIIVCPEGGYSSWYVNSPLQPASQFETFVASEVPAYIDARYPTQAKRSGRAISGLSMGGHGALYLALRHPDVFGMAGSMSGGVDLTESKGKFGISEVIGDSTQWANYSVLHTLKKASAQTLQLIIDCGTEDFFISGNRALHQKLLHMQVPHTYLERAGGHNWDYWRSAIRYQLLFFEMSRK